MQVDTLYQICQIFCYLRLNWDAYHYNFILYNMLKNEPKWINAPPELASEIPYLKAIAIKALQNDTIQYEIQTPKGKTKVGLKIKQTFQMSKGQLFDDMCQMNILNEPEVLRNLLQRYKKDEIFTYIGPTLIVVNPYRVIQRHFNNKVLIKIRDKVLGGNQKGDPHIYMIAGRAYQGLLYGQRKQAIIISGQSGAGKTQSTKYCMQMITSLSHKESHSIENKILACNPLLQAFGNAKTVRNDNSSRFGKYIQIFFGNDHTIKGANIISYLLQKSRVVSTSQNQRTYHAFYALAASKSYGVKTPQNYYYLKQSGCYKASNLDDAKYFQEINSSMNEIGFEKKDQQKIWSLVAGILQLGNIEFDDKRHQANQSHTCQMVNKNEIPKIAKIFGITSQALQKILLFQKKVMLKEVSYKPYSKLGCIANCNTLSKAIYSSVFQFIIYKIQLVLNPHSKQNLDSINLLDIFGFQNFANNSLQQLCINFTNQKLLKQYNKYVFENQMVILKQDGLEKQIMNINPPTNDDVISLLSDKRSFFSIINDNTPGAQFKDQDMMHGFQRDYSKSPLLKFDPINKSNFTIVHSQCKVTYNIQGFKLKNQDKVNSQIQEVYTKLFINSNKNQTGKTLLSKFVKEIEDLGKELLSASNHFVRCIKPNQDKQPQKVHQTYLLTQVRYLGVFQTIQIRQKTFPARKTYSQFIDNFQQVFESSKGKTGRQVVLAVLNEVKAKQRDFMLGIKRVYLNKDIQQRLNKALYQFLKVKIEKAIKIQKQYRIFIYRKKIKQNLKLFIRRKNIWRRFQSVQSKKIVYYGFKSIQQYYFFFLNKQIQQKQRQNRIQEEAKFKPNQKQEINQQTKEQKSLNKKIQVKQETSIKSNIDLKSLLVSSNKKYQDLDESIVVDTGASKYRSKKKVKKQQDEFQEGHFNSSFIEGESIYYTSNPQVLFQKNITLDLFNCKEGNLQKLQKILAEEYKLQISCSEEEFFSPNSQDCKFQIEDTPQQYLNKIIHFKAEDFFKQVLRKRTNFIGIGKDYSDILVAKNRPMNKSLTIMEQQDQDKALKVFKVIVRIGEQPKLDNVFRLIENMIFLCQSTTQQLKNQVFLQLIKQSNTSNELASIRIYQSMAVFLHIYILEQDFIMAGLYLFYKKLQDQKNTQKQEEHLRYLFKKMLRRIQNPPTIAYMPIKYQMMALMCKRQISIPVYLAVGNSILITVQSYDTFGDIKQRIILQFGINLQRFNPQMFKFFEIVNFQNEELQQSPLNENQIVWDVMTYWQLAKQKYKEANSNPPAFFLMLKITYAYQIYPDDIEAIELAFAQCYFDYFIGRIRLELNQMAALAACVKKIKLPNRPEGEVLGSYPIWMAKRYVKQQLAMAMVQNLKQIQSENLSLLEMKFRFLEVCQQCPLAMAMAIPTDQVIKVYFKPKKIYLTDRNQIQQEFSMRNIVAWAIDKQKFVFDVKGEKNKKVIYTEYAFSCNQFLSDIPKLLKNKKSK